MRHNDFDQEIGGFKRSNRPPLRGSSTRAARAVQHREERKNDRKIVQAARREQKRSVDF